MPTCPGWIGPDLVEHTGIVFAHRVATLQLGRRPTRASRRPVAMHPWLSRRTDAAADLAGEEFESGDAEVLARLHCRLAVAL